MTKCPACGYKYKGKRKVVRTTGALEVYGRCSEAWFPNRKSDEV